VPDMITKTKNNSNSSEARRPGFKLLRFYPGLDIYNKM